MSTIIYDLKLYDVRGQSATGSIVIESDDELVTVINQNQSVLPQDLNAPSGSRTYVLYYPFLARFNAPDVYPDELLLNGILTAAQFGPSIQLGLSRQSNPEAGMSIVPNEPSWNVVSGGFGYITGNVQREFWYFMGNLRDA